MMLSSSVRDGIMYGALALPVIGLLWIWRRKRKARWDIPETLPTARVGKRRGDGKLVGRAVPIVLIVLGIGTSYWAHAHAHEVLRVFDGGWENGLVRDLDRPIAAGAKAEVTNTFFDGMWLVNDSSRTVRVETVEYGMAVEPPPAIVFPPGTAGAFFRIDYVGPKHRPPESVMGSFGMATKYWLTWD